MSRGGKLPSPPGTTGIPGRTACDLVVSFQDGTTEVTPTSGGTRVPIPTPAASVTETNISALKSDIAEHGVLVPLEIDTEGRLLDGHHRFRAWTELRAEGVKVPDYPRIVRAGLSEDDKVAHVLALNLARRHLTPKQRAEVVLLLRGRGWSYRRIAPRRESRRRRLGKDLGAIAQKYAISLPARIERQGGGTYPARRASVMVNGIRDQRRALAALAELGDEVPPRTLNLRTIEGLALSARLSKKPFQGCSEGVPRQGLGNSPRRLSKGTCGPSQRLRGPNHDRPALGR